MELLGNYDDRDIYYLSGKITQLYTEMPALPAPYFSCTFFLHNSDWSKEELRKIIGFLIEHGAVLFLFHGNRCAEAHDLADEVQTEMMADTEITASNVIGTTWHERDSEEQVIFSTFCGSLPASEYLEKFRLYLVISLGTPEESDRIRELLTKLRPTIRKVVDEGT